MAVTNVYGNGTNSTAGANTVLHYYDRAGIKAATRVNVYGQFADKKSMPLKMGKTYKISKFLHMYDRTLADPDFAAKGYMTSRTIDSVVTALNNSRLNEGDGAVNKRSLQKVTFSTDFARYGEMIDYTDEVDAFSEDYWQIRYREELGELANSRFEDLIQRDMLATTTKMYAGAATSMATLGTGLDAAGAGDANWKVSFDLIRKSVRKLVRNRAKKNTTIVDGSVKIDTRTIDKAYYAVIGADVKADLEVTKRNSGSYSEEVAFIPVNKYAAAGTLVQGEVGAMHEVRFIESESAMVYNGRGAAIPGSYTGTLKYTNFADNASAIAARGAGAVAGNYFDVFPILFPTEGAFATVGLKGMDKIKFNAKSPSEVEINNPYGTQGFFSYNFWYAGIILEEEKLLRVDVLATA